MKEVNQLDQAALKNDFKNMYKDIGYTGCTQVLYELVLSAQILTEVMADAQRAIIEESKKQYDK